jgi:hypothetical protein
MRRPAPQHVAMTGLSHPMSYQAAVLVARIAQSAVEPRTVGNSVYPDGPSTAFISPLDGRAKP